MVERPEVLPDDVYNTELVSNLHPPDWEKPEPVPVYNLVVIGAGTAGLVSAAGAAGLGAKVALVERHLLGGDCLVHVQKDSDKILGATIVARHAGEMISEITLAMVANVGLKTISDVIHPYPTQAEAIKKIADDYNRTRLTPLAEKMIHGWLGRGV